MVKVLDDSNLLRQRYVWLGLAMLVLSCWFFVSLFFICQTQLEMIVRFCFNILLLYMLAVSLTLNSQFANWQDLIMNHWIINVLSLKLENYLLYLELPNFLFHQQVCFIVQLNLVKMLKNFLSFLLQKSGLFIWQRELSWFFTPFFLILTSWEPRSLQQITSATIFHFGYYFSVQQARID